MNPPRSNWRPAQTTKLVGLALLSILLPVVMAAQVTETAPSRQLPLNHMRFPAADSHKDGWYHLETAVGDDYFDGTSSVERVRRHLKAARDLGVKYLRCGFSWNAIEKSQGVYDWRFWDMLVREATNAHIELMPYVAYTPAWAASESPEFWNKPPRNEDWYADFMQAAVLRYRGKVHSWEIWNEPDNPEYWQGSVEQYASLARKAAIRMREADPSVVLVLGGMSRGPSEFFRELIEKFHIDAYVDVLAMHGYPETWGPERVEQIYHTWIPRMSEWIGKDGSGVGLWANELGYADFRFSANQASKWGGPVFYKYEHTGRYAADFLFKSEVMALASGRVSLTGWYRIDDFTLDTPHVSDDEVNFHLGLYDAQGHAKPAFYALKFFNRLFDEPVQLVPGPMQRMAGSQSNTELFRRKDGTLVFVGWLRSSEPSEASGNGTAADSREEDVSAKLPCRSVTQLRNYDVEGRTTGDGVLLGAGLWLQAKLRGDQVTVATFNCAQ